MAEMPIRAELKILYPSDWSQISRRVRFERAQGRCEACARPHGITITQLADGTWRAPDQPVWRDDRGEIRPHPTLLETFGARNKLVILACAHLDQDPRHNEEANLSALCGRCHLRHDAAEHARRRRLTARARLALGDLFLGRYEGPWQLEFR